ncbi:uncharacterized protein LOC132034137 isoform X2 [Lycium ferocissimum]|uniref:uncharacterized protein LOC132034137 isoform X2 n=1 Tax=Lycium ferocissimum TaxID=112874 RepID=UPI002815F22D|nr:uncharacterized protein LOC132034137 isoform X2 [Lycium ferocissimum]
MWKTEFQISLYSSMLQQFRLFVFKLCKSFCLACRKLARSYYCEKVSLLKLPKYVVSSVSQFVEETNPKYQILSLQVSSRRLNCYDEIGSQLKI